MAEQAGRNPWLANAAVGYPVALVVAALFLVDAPIQLYRWNPSVMVFGVPLLLVATIPVLWTLGARFHWLAVLLFILWVALLSLAQVLVVSIGFAAGG